MKNIANIYPRMTLMIKQNIIQNKTNLIIGWDLLQYNTWTGFFHKSIIIIDEICVNFILFYYNAKIVKDREIKVLW